MLFCSLLVPRGFNLFACGFQHVTYGAVADAAFQTFGDQSLKLRQFAHALLISPDEITHIVAGVAVASGLGLRLYPLFHGVGKRNIHCRHDENLRCVIMAKIGKDCQFNWRCYVGGGAACSLTLPLLRNGSLPLPQAGEGLLGVRLSGDWEVLGGGCQASPSAALVIA